MVLVTGASGFVGAHLTKALSDSGASVRALYFKQEPTPAMRAWPGLSWLEADLLDVSEVEALMKGVSEVYHCAAVVSFNPAQKAEIIHTNTEIAANIANAAVDAGVRKLVHISSVAALGRDGTTKEITEEAQWEESNLNSGYGLSKYGAEMEIWRAIGEGLDAVILNPGIILGAPMSTQGWGEGSPRLMQTAYKEFPFYTDGITAFVDIADVVRAALLLMQSDISSERFILSSGNYPFHQIFNQMADALGRKRPRFYAGPFATSLVWRWSLLQSKLSGGKPLITKETARNAQLKSFYKADKITQALPQFSYTPIETTITKMSKAYLAGCVA